MPRPKQSERDEILSDTRQRLLAAATESFARQGYAGANVDAISRAAGFAKEAATLPQRLRDAIAKKFNFNKDLIEQNVNFGIVKEMICATIFFFGQTSRA